MVLHQICDPLIVIDTAAGVGHADDLVPRQLGQIQPVLLHLADDLRFLQFGQARMRERVHGDLMAFIDFPHICRMHFIVRNALPFAHQHAVLPQLFGIEIERALEMIFVQQLNQADILRHAVVIAEGNSLFESRILELHDNLSLSSFLCFNVLSFYFSPSHSA